jgi:hypothetical protein
VSRQETATFTVKITLTTEDGELPEDKNVEDLVLAQMSGELDDYTGLWCPAVTLVKREVEGDEYPKTRLELTRNDPNGPLHIGLVEFDEEGMGVRAAVLVQQTPFVADEVIKRRFRDLVKLTEGNVEAVDNS